MGREGFEPPTTRSQTSHRWQSHLGNCSKTGVNTKLDHPPLKGKKHARDNFGMPQHLKKFMIFESEIMAILREFR